VAEDETDYDSTYHGILLSQHWLLQASNGFKVWTDYPVFKNKQGKRLMLPKELQVNPDKIVRYLNIKASVFIEPMNNSTMNATEAYYNQFANGD
jgi:hypothetical protein